MSEAVDGRSRRAAEAREQRRKQILETALEVFSEKGYHGTSISDLVKAAGVARGTFYLYFDSKHKVFDELLEDLLSTFRQSIVGVKPAPGMPPLQDQLVGVVARVLTTAQANQALTRIIFREAVGLDDAIQQRLNDFYAELSSYIALALQLGQSLSMVRPLNIDATSASILGSVRQVVVHYVVDHDGPVDVDGVARAVVDFSLGVVTA